MMDLVVFITYSRNAKTLFLVMDTDEYIDTAYKKNIEGKTNGVT